VAALEHVGVMEEAVEERRHGGGIAEEPITVSGGDASAQVSGGFALELVFGPAVPEYAGQPVNESS
jgi:hypothetical protein